jgi:hypothetical protein
MIFFCASIFGSDVLAFSDPLNDLHHRLQALKYISYVYQREGNYSSEGHLHKYEGKMFFDFTKKENHIGANCYFENNEYIAVYNGTELFHCDKRTQSLEVRVNLAPEEIDSEIFLPCSMLSIRNALPWVIEDKGVYKKYEDTVVNGIKSLKIQLEFKKKTISGIGTPWNILKRETLFYSIFVDLQTGLPFQVMMQNGENNDFFKTSFSDIIVDKFVKAPEEFYYSSYLNDFKLTTKLNKVELIAPYSKAPDFTLATQNTKEKIQLNKVNTPFTLIVFAIVNCGYSQEMVSKLNRIYHSKLSEKVTVLIVNPYDSEFLIDKFIELTKPHSSFRILVNGKSVALEYGISGYPTTVLLGKEKSVLFASPGFNEEAIVALLK